MQLLNGVRQETVETARLRVAYLRAGAGDVPFVLVHGNCSASAYFQDVMLALAESGRFTIYAPDMRGYGDTEPLPVDATRGVRDYSDDLAAFVDALHMESIHLLGWSLGGNVAMQYAIDHADHLRSLILEAPGAPYGFGGSKGLDGTPTYSDYAGSGGGTINPDFHARIAHQDRSNEQGSPRAVINTFYFRPPFAASPDREEMYVDGLLSTRTDDGHYSRDLSPSDNWPNVAPGTQGVNNALSPKYLNQSVLADITPYVPVLWLRGADDQIVSDTSFFDFGFLGQIGAVPGWPGAEVYPPQPMVGQMRAVLDAYRANGGTYTEIVLPECGHAPHIEKQADVVAAITAFIA